VEIGDRLWTSRRGHSRQDLQSGAPGCRLPVVIEGIKIEMSTAELRDHVQARADFHEAKAKWYRDHAASLREGRDPELNLSNDPVSSLERSRESHEQKAAYFKIIAKYLIASETYRLAETDLARLEFSSAYF